MPLGPERRPPHRLLELGARSAGGRADVEAHRHVGAEALLDARGQLRCEPLGAAVVYRPERHALVVHVQQRVAEREHLEPARVGEDRAVPAHERVQAAELGDEVLAGPEVEVVRVAEKDARAERAKFVRVDGLDRCLRSDGHERRRRHIAVSCVKDAGARGTVGGLEGEAHRISIASPNE